MIQTTNGRFVSCVSLCFPCYAQGAEIHEIFGKGKRFSERAHTSLILGLAAGCDQRMHKTRGFRTEIIDIQPPECFEVFDSIFDKVYFT